jgi:hypothetical protein
VATQAASSQRKMRKARPTAMGRASKCQLSGNINTNTNIDWRAQYLATRTGLTPQYARLVADLIWSATDV